jgi:5-methylthioadenosine/S-adenosylhomocysteine deaminase
LINARETDIALVLIDGVRRYGGRSLVEGFDQNAEDWDVGGEPRKFSLAEDTADPDVGALTLREAYEKLADGLNRLPELTKQLEHPSSQFVNSMLDPASTNGLSF